MCLLLPDALQSPIHARARPLDTPARVGLGSRFPNGRSNDRSIECGMETAEALAYRRSP